MDNSDNEGSEDEVSFTLADDEDGDKAIDNVVVAPAILPSERM
jgi:hypothetical protein